MGGFKNSLLPHFLQFLLASSARFVKPENLCYIQGISNIQISPYYNFQIHLQSVFENHILKQIFVGHSCIIFAKSNVNALKIIFQKKMLRNVSQIMKICPKFQDFLRVDNRM